MRCPLKFKLRTNLIDPRVDFQLSSISPYVAYAVRRKNGANRRGNAPPSKKFGRSSKCPGKFGGFPGKWQMGHFPGNPPGYLSSHPGLPLEYWLPRPNFTGNYQANSPGNSAARPGNSPGDIPGNPGCPATLPVKRRGIFREIWDRPTGFGRLGPFCPTEVICCS